MPMEIISNPPSAEPTTGEFSHCRSSGTPGEILNLDCQAVDLESP